MPYVPHTEEDISQMLETIGVSSIDALFHEVPVALRDPDISLPEPLSEQELREDVDRLGSLNRTTKDYLSFLGGGAYERIRPSLVDALISRAEFSTSYTPYQAEVSQGTLQFIFEFQSLIVALTGMEVANASMYDGASALAEAALMSLRVTRKNQIIYAATIHPRWKQTLKTYLSGTGAELLEIPEEDGAIDLNVLESALDGETAAVLLQHPNFWGYVEPVEKVSDRVSSSQALLVEACDPISLGILEPPGGFGADIVVGELQSLGLPLSFGGPYAGYFACKEKYARQLPGRLVGRTKDLEGRTGYVLTLQTREQHIRRDKATSNICTNQSLCALSATIYLACLGQAGFQEVARQNFDKAHYLAEGLCSLDGISPLSGRPFFNEFTVVLEKDSAEVARELKKAGILAGVYGERWTGAPNRLIVCATETKKKADLDRAIEAFKKALNLP
jgi:glycine dehydrogenase subunit 1